MPASRGQNCITCSSSAAALLPRIVVDIVVNSIEGKWHFGIRREGYGEAGMVRMSVCPFRASAACAVRENTILNTRVCDDGDFSRSIWNRGGWRSSVASLSLPCVNFRTPQSIAQTVGYRGCSKVGIWVGSAVPASVGCWVVDEPSADVKSIIRRVQEELNCAPGRTGIAGST